jgi:hypothetical protein
MKVAAAVLALLLPSSIVSDPAPEPAVGSCPQLTTAAAANGVAGVQMFTAERCQTVYFVRHAEGEHNAAERTTALRPRDRVLLESESGRKYWDAPLTARGEAQCRALRARLEHPAPMAGGWPGVAAPLSPPAPRQQQQGRGCCREVELVVASSLRRALQTAEIALGPARQWALADSAAAMGGVQFVASVRPSTHHLCRSGF